MNNMTNRIITALLWCFVAVLPTTLRAQQPDTASNSAVRIKEELPFDTAVRVGQLPNGFTYYIRKNTEPANRAVFYLVNKVGSILEEEDQLGLAHFTEHIAFKGTKHYPKQDLINYLQKAGVRFGADLNAYTSFNETVYQLPIPSDNPELVNNGLQILRDWAQDVVMDASEIESERGVILEEKRLRKGVTERIQELILPVTLNHSRYVKRLPIGSEQVLSTFEPETLRRFYRDWYRPDLQALIAVGDFDVDSIEKMIQEKFADLVNPADAPERTIYKVPLSNKQDFVIITDEELTSTNLQILMKFPSTGSRTKESLRKSMVRTLFNNLLAYRISELSKQRNPPFLGAKIGLGNVFSGIDAATLSVTVKPGELEQGLKAVWAEIVRVKKFGFTQTELDRVKASFMQGQEYRQREKDKTVSETYVKQYVQVFLHRRANPGADYLYQFYKDHIAGIELEDVHVLIDYYDDHNNRNMVLTAPEKDKATLPNETLLLRWLEETAGDTTLQAYVDNAVEEKLIDILPPKGSILKEIKNEHIGTSELLLSNGIKVILKPTDFKNDQVMFSSFSPGGTSLYGDNDYQSAINAPSIITASGLDNFDSKTLPKMLSGKVLKVAPYIGEHFEGINGQSSLKDLETALQLVYLYFVSPRLDEAVIAGIIDNFKSSIKNRYNKPENVFADTINAVLGNYHVRKTPPSLAKIDQISLQRALEIYGERFADASDFTFIFTGSFKEEDIKPLLEQYLAVLPALNRQEKGLDLGIEAPEGKIEKVVHKGKEEKATVRLVATGKYEPDPKTNLQLNALQEILKIKLTERLRMKESGIYAVNVALSHSRIPRPRFSMNISFGCAPENVDKLVAATKEEIAQMLSEGPTETEVEKYKAEAKRGIELGLKSNGYWHNYLHSTYQYGLDPDEILHTGDRLEQISATSLQNTARKYLTMENLIQFVLLPEK